MIYSRYIWKWSSAVCSKLLKTRAWPFLNFLKKHVCFTDICSWTPVLFHTLCVIFALHEWVCLLLRIPFAKWYIALMYSLCRVRSCSIDNSKKLDSQKWERYGKNLIISWFGKCFRNETWRSQQHLSRSCWFTTSTGTSPAELKSFSCLTRCKVNLRPYVYKLSRTPISVTNHRFII